ncbi:MAG: OsmC family protein [Burkholderiaceae bacterium]|jgi:putative redox protein
MTVYANKSEAGKLAYTIGMGTHALSVDATHAEGGDDLGPSPHDLFDASLAACTALTVTMYAQRKGWLLEEARVTVERDSSQESQGVYRLDRRLELIGSLDAEQRERLLQIAERCPIHKLMMHTRIEIATALIEAGSAASG